MPQDVLITGANGRVGTALLRHLRDDPAYRVTPLDIEADDDDTIVADVRDPDALLAACNGKDALVHLALSPDIGSDRTATGWTTALSEELTAITNAYHAAVETTVDRMVFPSTHQLIDPYVEEVPAPRDEAFVLDHTVPIRPTSQYALAKAYGEAYGRFCAERHDLRVYCLRIGWVQVGGAEHPYAAPEAAAESGEVARDSEDYHDLADRPIWLSGRDTAHLVDCCLRDRTVEFDIFYGSSNNEGCWLDIDRARTVLGYAPQDDASEWNGPPDDPQ